MKYNFKKSDLSAKNYITVLNFELYANFYHHHYHHGQNHSLFIYLFKKFIVDTITDAPCWTDFPGISVRRFWEYGKSIV